MIRLKKRFFFLTMIIIYNVHAKNSVEQVVETIRTSQEFTSTSAQVKACLCRDAVTEKEHEQCFAKIIHLYTHIKSDYAGGIKNMLSTKKFGKPKKQLQDAKNFAILCSDTATVKKIDHLIEKQRKFYRRYPFILAYVAGITGCAIGVLKNMSKS